MKDFVVQYGRMLIDIGAWIVLIFILFLALGMLFDRNEDLRFAGLLLLIIGPIIFIQMYYFIYVFIDIRDLLAKLVKNSAEETKGNSTQEHDRFAKYYHH